MATKKKTAASEPAQPSGATDQKQTYRMEYSHQSSWSLVGDATVKRIVEAVYKARVARLVDEQLAGKCSYFYMSPPGPAEREAVKAALLESKLFQAHDFAPQVVNEKSELYVAQ